MKANQENKANPNKWLDEQAEDESRGLNPEAVTKKIAELAGPNDTYAVDTGTFRMGRSWVTDEQEPAFAISFICHHGLWPAWMAGALSVPMHRLGHRQVMAVSPW